MLFTDTITISYVGASTSTSTITESANLRSAFDDSIPDSTTNQEITISCRTAGLKSARFVSDAAVTLKTNSTTADDTIILVADVPRLYAEDGEVGAIPFTTTNDITSIFVSNASGGAAHLQIDLLYDGTP